MAAWFWRQQEFDALIKKKFSDVPVDPTIKDRILNAVAREIRERGL